MKWITYINSLGQLNEVAQAGINEVIIGQLSFSRFTKIDFESCNQILNESKKKKMRTHFEWDILMDQNDLNDCLDSFKNLNVDNIDVFRLKDPGAIEYILNKTDKPIQLIVEGNNHNLLALKSWEKYLGDRLERFILSIELPLETLIEYRKKLNTKTELLALGRILLFYTPRKLLSPIDDKRSEYIELMANSEESVHKEFMLLENRHGTFMFHPKHFYLLDHLGELKECVDFARIDLRFDLENTPVLNNLNSTEKIKENYPKKMMRGFFHRNKSDVLFKKLKNHRLQKRDDRFLGEVIGVEKNKMILFNVFHRDGVQNEDQMLIHNPDGKIINGVVKNLRNIDFVDIDSAKKDQLVSMSYIKGVWPKAIISKFVGNDEDTP